MFSSVYIVALQTVMLNLGRKVNEVVTHNFIQESRGREAAGPRGAGPGTGSASPPWAVARTREAAARLPTFLEPSGTDAESQDRSKLSEPGP